MSCHQIGNKPTREINPELGTFESSEAAWAKRVTFGHDGGQMDQQLTALGRNRALKMFADWTDRIAKGEYPAEAPPRPQGLERNVVITQWDWADPREYFHDVIASDKRNPLDQSVRSCLRAARELVGPSDHPRAEQERVDPGHDSDQPRCGDEPAWRRAADIAVLGE